MIKRQLQIFLFLGISLLSINCATVIKGYESTTRLTNAPADIRVTDHEGREIPVITKVIRVNQSDEKDVFIDKEVKDIILRSNKEWILHLRYQDKEKIVTLYPKIGFGWAILDFACGIIPSFYDAYTGCWNKFPDVDAQFQK